MERASPPLSLQGAKRPLFVIASTRRVRGNLTRRVIPCAARNLGEIASAAPRNDTACALVQRFEDGNLEVVGLPDVEQDRVILGLGPEFDQSKSAMRVRGRLGQHLAEQLC